MFGMKEVEWPAPVVEPLKHEPLVSAVDHFASLLAGGVGTRNQEPFDMRGPGCVIM
jgi:hypothetical protein